MPVMRDEAAHDQVDQLRAVAGRVVMEAGVGEGGLEEVLDRVRDARDRDAPPTIASSASEAIATLIGQSRSATWCSGPGKPTSVSSGSPVIGFTGSPWAMPPAASSRASGTGSP